MSRLKFFDSTLRDGSHANKHQFNEEQIISYCRQADDVGFHSIIVGHGNGLGASSLQVGISRLTDGEMLTLARENLKKTKLGVFFIPGWATIKDNLRPAIDLGVEMVLVATHCTESNVSKQYIEYLTSNDIEVHGVLLMHHMTTTPVILSEATRMQSYGAKGVILMDSAGSSNMEMVEERIGTLVSELEISVGFHAHNNLGLAVANSYISIKAGADIIDGTSRGFGAGAGNVPLEVIIGLLEKNGIPHHTDLYKVMDLAENFIDHFYPNRVGNNSNTLISGIAGVFSGFLHKVKNVAYEFGVDSRDIFMELGRMKVLAGQEDKIIEVARSLSQK